ncbi:MAG: hypothetical protein RRA35_00025 [Desulfomonilia bacterium]|nr:hypothetical protein [Desulfomonilia bacterium]
MALDEPNENDETFETGGFTFVIEKELLGQAQPIKVDYITSAMGSGFVISSGLKDNNACGSCTSC